MILKKNNCDDSNFDALPYDDPDVLHNRTDILILAYYVILNVKEPLSEETLIDALTDGGFANYFEAANAIQKIKDTGFIGVDEEGYFTVKKDCRNYVEALQDSLPPTMRERAVKNTAKAALRALYKKENDVEIVKKSDTCYFVTMHIIDSDEDMMALTLRVASDSQAQIIKERFYNDPESIYMSTIDALFLDNGK